MHQSPTSTEDSKHNSVWGNEYPIPRADMPLDAPTSFPPIVSSLRAAAERIILCALPSDPLPLIGHSLLSSQRQNKDKRSDSTRRHATVLCRCRGRRSKLGRGVCSRKAGESSDHLRRPVAGDGVRAAPAAANRQPARRRGAVRVKVSSEVDLRRSLLLVETVMLVG